MNVMNVLSLDDVDALDNVDAGMASHQSPGVDPGFLKGRGVLTQGNSSLWGRDVIY